MGGVIDGQQVKASVTNAAFIEKNADDGTTFNFYLMKDVGNGSSGYVSDVQRYLNHVSAYTGASLTGAYNAYPTWTSNHTGLSTNTLFARIQAHDDLFSNSGHTHDGTDGNGGQISALNLAHVNLYRADWQTFTFTISGASNDVSASFSGKVSGGGTSTAGVITSAPYNRVEIRDTSNGSEILDGSGNKVYGRLTYSASVWTLTYYVFNAGVESAYSPSSVACNLYYREVFTIETLPTIGADVGAMGSLDATADVVDASTTMRGLVSVTPQTFAGLKKFNGYLATYDSTPVSTDYYVIIRGLSSTTMTADRYLTLDLKNADRTLSMAANLTVSATATVSGTNSGDVTLNAVGSSPNANGASLSTQSLTLQPADGSNPGIVTAGTQTIGGSKTFSAEHILSNIVRWARANDTSSTGASVVLSKPATGVVKVTNVSLTSVAGVAAGSNEQIFVLCNGRGNDITILNDNVSASAGQKIYTGTGGDITLANNASLILFYDSQSAYWKIIGGTGSGSGSGTPTVTGSRASPQAISTNIAFTGTNYKNIWFVSGSGGSTVITANPAIDAGTNVGQELTLIGRSNLNWLELTDGSGLSLNGTCTLFSDSVLNLIWDGTNWVETSRR